MYPEFMESLANRPALTALLAMIFCAHSATGQDWSTTKYSEVIEEIRRHHDQLPTTASTTGFMLGTPDVTGNMVEMSYMFGYDDAQFGINGYMPLLNKYEVVGKDPSWIPYNLHTINQDAVGISGFVKAGSPLAADGLNDANTPWLTKSGELLQYLNQRTEQWDLGLDPTSDLTKNPWRRAAATVGMFYDTAGQNNAGSYANNYIVTFTVDQDAIFRPNGNQSVFGPGMDTAIAADFQWDAGMDYWEPNPAFNAPWLSSLNNNLYQSSNGSKYATFGSFYKQWWQQNLIDGTNFPWTGIGYTYDWYYQNRLEWSHLGPGNQPKGAGLSEFVLMPSQPSDLWEIGNIVSIQTTAQYLGDTQQWGSSMQTYSTPEPTSLYVFGITAALFAGIKLSRRTKQTLSGLLAATHSSDASSVSATGGSSTAPLWTSKSRCRVLHRLSTVWQRPDRPSDTSGSL